MKKISVFLVLILLLFCNACSKGYFYAYEDLIDGLISVEIVDLSIIDEGGKEIVVHKMLNEEEKKHCLRALSGIKFYELSPIGSPINVQGKCIKLNYPESSLIIGIYGVCEFSEDNGFSLGWQNGESEKIESLIYSFINK